MRADAGFTLIEALVALAILATAAISLLAATEAHVSRITGLETRALAQIAAENHLAELEIGAEPAGAVEMLGHAFEIDVARVETADPDLVRLDIAVRAAEGGTVLDGFVGFVDAQVLR